MAELTAAEFRTPLPPPVPLADRSGPVRVNPVLAPVGLEPDPGRDLSPEPLVRPVPSSPLLRLDDLMPNAFDLFVQSAPLPTVPPPRSDSEVKARPELKPELKPEPRPDAKPEPRPDPKPDARRPAAPTPLQQIETALPKLEAALHRLEETLPMLGVRAPAAPRPLPRPAPVPAAPPRPAASAGLPAKEQVAFLVDLPPDGDLLAIDAARVLGWVIATGYTGAVRLWPTSGSARPTPETEDQLPHRELWFERGALLGAYSTLAGDTLVDALAGLLTKAQLQRARAELQGTDTRDLRGQIERLQRAQLLDRKAALSLLGRHVTELVHRALLPGPGRFRLIARALPPERRIPVPIPLRRALVEGLRQSVSLDFLRRRVGPLASRLQPSGLGEGAGVLRGGAALLSMGLSPAEERALGLFDGQMPLGDVMNRAQLGEHAVYVLAYALLCLGALSLPAGSQPGAARPAPRSAPPPSQPSADPAAAAIRRVQDKYRQIEAADYFALLGLPPEADGDAVRRAHTMMRAEFAPQSQPLRCRSAMDRELRQIAHVLDEALVALGDDGVRAAYAASLPR